MNTITKQPHEKEILGHPVGLYVLLLDSNFLLNVER